ncbi:MAG: lamin tail domain-containing protein [Bacteroidales bacterium]|nr:lamin tail domain-containing protein [Bacteroidales bacterium]MBP5796217.1 lamin tail domain-containing protein [Bacteroidales bacterium]
MKKKIFILVAACLALPVLFAISCSDSGKTLPCDIYEADGTPCVTAHSTTRLLYSKYNGPLYQIQRDSDGKTLDIGAVKGYADAAAQDAFLKGTLGRITIIYDQSGKGNNLEPAGPGTFKGPDTGEFNTQSIADMAPVLINGRKAYGVFVMPGMGYRCNNAQGLAINDEPEGIYYVIDGTHYDSGCCFDYGNSSTNGNAVGTGTMETTYYGTSTAWGSGNGEGPWIMSDMEAGLFSGYDPKKNDVPSIDWQFVSVFVNGGGGNQWDLRGADATTEELTIFYSGVRPHTKEGRDSYYPMSKKGGMLLGNGGDNGNGSSGTFFEGVMTFGYPSDEAINAVQKNIASVKYQQYPVKMTRLTTFVPGSGADVSVAFTNPTGKTLKNFAIEAELPQGWSLEPAGQVPSEVPAGQSVTAVYTVKAPDARSMGFLSFNALWKGGSAAVSTRVRSAEALKINEVKLSAPQDPNDQFIELYNASGKALDLSGMKVEVRRSGWAPVTAAVIPSGTSLGAGEYYVLTLADAAVTAPAAKGATEVLLSSDVAAGKSVNIGGKAYKVSAKGAPAGAFTTLFTPVSTGPKMAFAAGATNLPVTSVAGFQVGHKMGIDLGGDYEIVEVTAVGTPSTQTVLSKEAKAGDTQLVIETTQNLIPGSVITINTGARIEKATVKTLVKSSGVPVRQFRGAPPHEPGIVELEAPLKQDHMLAVDVSCPGTGITFTPATKFAHISGQSVQPLGSPYKLAASLEKDAVAFEAAPVAAKGNQQFGYALSASAGSIALIDAASGAVVDAIVYGSQQSNSSGNGTIASPELATLEGVQDGGGCIAVVPSTRPQFVRPGMPVPPPEKGPGKSLVRFPDGKDADVLCKDFSITGLPTPGTANTVAVE